MKYRLLQCFHTRRQPRELARRCVAFEQALGNTAPQLRLNVLQSRLRCFVIACSKSLLDFLDICSQTAHPRDINIRAFGVSSDALAR